MNSARSIVSPVRLNGQAVETAGSTFPWIPDRGDGSYRNPIIYADYSDPDVIRVGDDFYLTASSFNCTPGLPILHSKDLVNWKIVNHALKNLPHSRYERVQPGCGVWAPSLRYHAGKFWIFFPMPDEGIFLVTADHPAGSWSQPHCVRSGKGLIDPCPLWDEDGRAYLVHAYAGSRAGIKHRLQVCPMVADGSRLLDEGKTIFHEPERHPTLEGPKFYKRDGWYYILAPAGGVEAGWQLALRSKNVYGPYEDKIVLAQGDTDINGPHQGGLVDTSAGDWWFVHFQDAGVYGRVVHLQPVQWRDGWPMMGKSGEPVSHFRKPILIHGQKSFLPQTSDEFDGSKLGPQWQWNANHNESWYSLVAHPGWLRLYPQLAVDPINEQPNLLLQKFPARSFTVETELQFSPGETGEEAGVVVVGEKSVKFGVRFDGKANWLMLGTDDDSSEWRHQINGNHIKLRVLVHDGARLTFGFLDEDELMVIPRELQATKGKWVGARLGMYSGKSTANTSDSWADFNYFRFI